MEQNGFQFSFDPSACSRCEGKCCRGSSGAVYVDTAEIGRIAAFVGSSTVDLMRNSLVMRENRWTIRENVRSGEYLCVFFSVTENRCRIYPVRPAQCHTYPFWDHFRSHPEQLVAECPGVRLKQGNRPAGCTRLSVKD